MAVNTPDPTRILSVQSHVVSGFVGNRSATFPLQLLGWDVDVANTVQFSNHTGYGRWGGLRFDAAHLQDLFDGLEKNGLLRYSRMLTGYMPSAAVVETVLKLVKKLRARQAPDSRDGGLIYLLDPVMGDMGRGMYVAPEVLPIYQQMLPYSTIITPNQFEAQTLTGIQITDLASLQQVLLSLHNTHKVPHVIITSVELPSDDLTRIGASSSLPDGRPAMLQIGSSCTVHLDDNGNRISPGIATDQLEMWMIQFPEVQGYFSGVGDMFAALTLGRFRPEDLEYSSTAADASQKPITPIARASELAIASLQGILKNTCRVIESLESQSEQQKLQDQQKQEKEKDQLDEAQKRVDTMRVRELRVVQSKSEIENPSIVYRAKWLP
ncbi:Ribokinase-like protein [Testicularia cyperi]|uniref:pyridoxal kinase n=1 Tax=Testicularia cyperi TaxID=1882483 RepID=A0A317XVA2_9BASI|nr:Ribokinase-like protein [Testicularia cyperi]